MTFSYARSPVIPNRTRASDRDRVIYGREPSSGSENGKRRRGSLSSISVMREEYLAKEQASWDAFLQSVEAVPEEGRTDPTVVPGWSVQDLVWHCAGWAGFAGDHLEQMRDGTFVDPFE